MHLRHLVLLMTCLLLLAGCWEEEAPVRLGLIAGLSGSNADFGQAGRNGAMLAVEEINRAGGINGRPIELVVRDNRSSPETAIIATRELVDEQVAAIVGPFSSSISKAMRSVTEIAEMLVFSPTATSDEFLEQDDYFFRLGTLNSESARNYAKFMVERRGIRRVSLAVDQTNPVFAKSFVKAFSTELRSLGGEVVGEVWQDFRTLVGFDDQVARLRDSEPDAIFLLTNAVDAARIAQQFRKADTRTRILVCEWATTRQLIELGGKAVEGVEILQPINGFSTGEKYLRFVENYKRRFDVEPSYASALTYEVVSVLREALEKKKTGESLKQAILANRPYQGLQQALVIDDYGDTHRTAYFLVVKNAKFVPAP